MEKHYASIWESIADVVGDQVALVHGQNRRTWTEYDDRSARLAQALLEAGLTPNSKVGLYLYNSNEYMEVQYASMKIRGVPININYRYLDDELLYLLENSDAEALVFHSSLGDRVARVMERTDKVRLWIQVDDGGESVPGAVAYEELVTAHDPAARVTRSADDLYMLYTGGTTGMPKGVMYDTGAMVQFFMSLGFPILGLGNPEPKEVASVVKAAYDEGRSVSSIPACPPHARNRHVVGRHDAAPCGGQGCDAAQPVSGCRRIMAIGSGRSRHTTRDRGRCFCEAHDQGPRRRAKRRTTLRPFKDRFGSFLGRHVDH